MIEFTADKVSIKTGKADNSGTVTFDVGEYELPKLKELIGITDKIIRVTVEIED